MHVWFSEGGHRVTFKIEDTWLLRQFINNIFEFKDEFDIELKPYSDAKPFEMTDEQFMKACGIAAAVAEDKK